MRRTALLLTLSLSASAGAVDATHALSGMTWWQTLATVAIALTVPVTTGVLTYRLGTRRADQSAIAQRDAADLQAIQTRDKAFSDVLALLTQQNADHDKVIAAGAAAQARLDMVEVRQKEREEREREQIAKIARLEASYDAMATRVDACLGGSTCPLARTARLT